MPITRWWDRARELPGAPRTRGLGMTAEAWSQCAADVAAGGGRLLAMWGSTCAASSRATDVYAAFLIDHGMLILELPLQHAGGPPTVRADYPGIEALFPCASRMQRAMLDVSSVRSSDADQRPWLRHPQEGYDFIRVSGDGVQIGRAHV